MNNKTPDLLLRRISQGYEEQIPAYEEMYSLALEQGYCIQADEEDMTKLAALISRRQGLINRLEDKRAVIRRLEEEVISMLCIPEFTLSKIAANCGATEVSHLSQALEKFTALIVSINNVDKMNEETLRIRIKETAENLGGIQKEKKARKAYQHKATNNGGVFVDLAK